MLIVEHKENIEKIKEQKNQPSSPDKIYLSNLISTYF